MSDPVVICIPDQMPKTRSAVFLGDHEGINTLQDLWYACYRLMMANQSCRFEEQGHLARMIFCKMVRDDPMSPYGHVITSTPLCSPDHPWIVINISTKELWLHAEDGTLKFKNPLAKLDLGSFSMPGFRPPEKSDPEWLIAQIRKTKIGWARD